MKFGCCVNMLPKSDGVGSEYFEALKELGYDYVELPLKAVSQLEEAQFEALLKRLEELELPCICCNDFMPPSFQLAGENPTDRATLQDYVKRAMERVSRLGAPYAVFGSPWSRSCPEGFPKEKALDQIAAFLEMAAGWAQKYGVTLAIEHNNREETNTMNHFSDAVAMARRMNHPNVKVLCDYYHVRSEGDDPTMLLDGGELLVHTHIAPLEGRRYLTDLSQEPMLAPYAKVLKQLGYEGGVSIEGKVDSAERWREEARVTLENLRAVFG